MPTLLRGIAWDHSRAFPPLVAAAQRFGEMHPGVEVRWSKRTLHDFGHADVATLAREFDLLIVDHPFAGEAVAHQPVLMLQERIDTQTLKKLREGTMGPSFESYMLDGNLIALPIDVATQIASCRMDLLAREQVTLPTMWAEVVELAKRGRVLIPGFHVDVLLTFLGMCVSQGSRMFDGVTAVEHETGVVCLRMFRELAKLLPEETWKLNPIAVYERLTSSDDFAYCPFAYGYTNYARKGFASHRLQFADLVMLPDGKPLRGVLGGTGVAISATCKAPDAAAKFAEYVSSEVCQRHLYLLSGGQPADAATWRDPAANALTSDFFSATARSTNEAWVRPRYAGYIQFQERAGIPIVRYLREGGNEAQVLQEVDGIYQQSQLKGEQDV